MSLQEWEEEILSQFEKTIDIERIIEYVETYPFSCTSGDMFDDDVRAILSKKYPKLIKLLVLYLDKLRTE